ncbi:hypothetical protein R1sor_025701 [Riccia sorocarpa]|uniref:WRC domain-containing protein n=1 Tax=Riccia sorocarpa TaxID=122646 RepID=A0ABD3G9C6_9MARC
MRIRKRRPQEVDHSSFQSAGSSGGNLQRRDHVDRVEICSENFGHGTRSGGEAAALSLTLLASDVDPRATQDKVEDARTRNFFSLEPGKDFGREYRNELPEQLERTRDGDKNASVEKDLNHPSNKPRGSLLYSLYCVFSQLSGKAVLTAREALSKIIEEGLPGLDEGSGMHSVQVAKVLRSNPYFIHLEGGKFLLCSGSSPPPQYDHHEDLDLTVEERMLHPLEDPNAITAKRGIAEEARDYTGVRNKRAKSKSSSSSSTESRDSSKTRGQETGRQRVAKSQDTSTSQKDAQGNDAGVPICKRYDGRGWKCHEKALEGYSMCRHHHELIVNRLARLRSSGKLGPKKSQTRRKAGGKQIQEQGPCETEPESNYNQQGNGVPWRKNVKARSLKSISS